MRISKKSLIIYLILAVIIVAGLWFGPDIFSGKNPLGGAPASVNTGATQEEIVKAGVYKHPEGLFSFTKPEGYGVGRTSDPDGRDVLLVQPLSGDVKRAFQIGITVLDEPMTITPDLIRAEIPDIEIRDAKRIVLDEKGSGVMFKSNNPAFSNDSFEIWFTTKTHLYQISSYGEFGDELQGIIGTWKF